MQYAKRIFQARPSLILSIDNEYLSWKLLGQINCKPLSTTHSAFYDNSALQKPQRQFMGRLVRDYKAWVGKYVDFMHYTLPLAQASRNYYQFPSQYIGNFGHNS